MSANKLTALAVLGLLGATSAASAQGLGNSPYSRLGLGDITPNTGGIRHQGMGGVGLAAPNAVQVNDLNPALTYYVNRTTYEAAFTGIMKRLQTSSASQKVGNGSLGYLAFGLPISRRWGAAVSLRPLSLVDYKSQQVGNVPNSPARVLQEYTGSGGLTQVALAQGVRVAKGLTAGVTAAYVFGSIDRSSSALINPYPDSALSTEVLRKVVLTDHVQYNDFMFRAGLHYRYDLNKKLAMNLAGVYTFQTNLSGTRTQQQDEQNTDGTSLLVAPVQLESVSGHTVLPSSWQGGISFDNNKNWSVSADVARQQWSKFQDFGTTTIGLNDTWRVGLGGELSPDPSSVTNYFKRVSYRAGISLNQLPYRPGGQTLYDRAVSWGFSFPFPTSSPLDATVLNVAFTYGQRGNTDQVTLNGLRQSNIKETYLKAQVGVSLNNRWFIKRRIE